jgi:hypothetical protein
MARESICVIVDDPVSVTSAEEWLAENRSRLDFLSENLGCGCCVDLYDLEGPEEVLQTIPQPLLCWTAWACRPEESRRLEESALAVKQLKLRGLAGRRSRGVPLPTTPADEPVGPVPGVVVTNPTHRIRS